MDISKKLKYTLLFEKMIDLITEPEHFDREELDKQLGEFCELFHISKITTEFYKSLSDERNKTGDIINDYDNGHGDKVALHRRYVSKTQAVLISSVYIAQDEEMFDGETYQKVDIVMRALQNHISLNRLQGAFEKLIFFDGEGHPNINYFLKQMDTLNEKNELIGKNVSQINLKHFSLINQEIGREAADLAIHNYYTDFQEMLGNDGIICRVGGDTFCLMYNKEKQDEVSDFINGHSTIYDFNENRKVMLSAYAGVYNIPEDFIYDRPGEILNRMISALAEAKQPQNSNIVYFQEESLMKKAHAMRIHHEFEDALDNNEFKVFYQPKVDVLTGHIVGAEALCRWFHEGRIVPPGEFIPILEENTDICTLDFRMLDMVCKDIRRWIDDDMKVVRISVNLSRRHLIDANLLDHLLKIINSNKVPHEYIEIELTETTTDVEFKDLKRISSALQKEGISTSVDDFGMGYSSLNLIREVPFNVLKIDRCFLPSPTAGSNNTTTLMYSYVVSMAHSIGLDCITEGVETAEQLEILRKNRCETAQGFLFDKPLPVREFEDKMDIGRYDIPT